MNYRLLSHARKALQKRRRITQAMLDDVLQNPQQIVAAGLGRKAYQSQMVFPNGKTFLVWAIVDDTVDPVLVYTVYFTDKIARYWRQP